MTIFCRLSDPLKCIPYKNEIQLGYATGLRPKERTGKEHPGCTSLRGMSHFFSTRPTCLCGVAGPKDLSVKKPGHASQSAVHGLCSQLNAVEVATVRQLIAGYRESAAFLYRSADELEQLLLNQH